MISQSKTKEGVLLGLGAFTERLLVTRKCANAIVDLLRVMNEVEFSEIEVDTSISRTLHVFQSKDKYLRMVCYAFIRQAMHLSSGAFIAINALINEINSKKDVAMRAESLKLLLQITPTQMLEDTSKYVHQALIEGQSLTLSLIAPVCLFLPTQAIEGWFSSVTWVTSLEKSGPFGNAILLMSRVRPHDNRTLLRIICSTYLKGYSAIQALRFIVPFVGTERSAYDRFESSLRLENTDEGVFIEAVRSIVRLKDVDPGHFVAIAIPGLKTLLSSPRSVTRFAALRSVEVLSGAGYKDKLGGLRGEIEEMLNKGKGIALLAMSVLLRIGTEKIADRISKQLPKLMSEMADEQKMSVIDSVGRLCSKFGSRSWIPVLEKALSDRGTCEYKIRVVGVISDIVRSSADKSLERELETVLCRYIEDSYYPIVTMEILGILAGNKEEQYTASVMNRLLLDNDTVRMAAQCVLGSIEKGSGIFNVIFSETLVPRKEKAELGAEFHVSELRDKKEQILLDLGDYAKEFEEKKREVSQIEQVFNSEELKAGKAIALTRPGAEFGVSVRKHMFRDFIVLEYEIESKIDMTLEQGRLDVFDGKRETVISSDELFLRGKERGAIHVKINYETPADIAGTPLSTVFYYVVNDNRDYETGEIKMDSFMVTGSDFLAKPDSEQAAPPEFGEECLKREFRLGLSKEQAISELKKVFDLPVAVEDESGFRMHGASILDKKDVFIQVGVQEGRAKSSRALVAVCCEDEALREMVMGSVA